MRERDVLRGGCTSETSCVAVGFYVAPSPEQELTLVESWDGAAWTIVASPSPSARTNIYLQSVSCVSASSCVAVGTYDKPNYSPVGLTEIWDGSSWTVGRAPVGDVTPINHLFSVSCSRTDRCMAVGYQNTVDAMLIEQWDGHRWSVMAIPILAQGFGLNGVSCASASSCAAVGEIYVGLHVHTVFYAWDGAVWTAQEGVSPGTDSNHLLGVACPSVSHCIAVGEYSNPGPKVRYRTLIESWDGTTWTLARSPNPAAPERTASLYGVACSSRQRCVAVGSASSNKDTHTLALTGH